MQVESRVLLSWIAINNDPFERDHKKGSCKYVNGEPILGPTLTVLFDEESPYAGGISDVVLLHRMADAAENYRELCAVKETENVLNDRQSSLNVHIEVWRGNDPTDHRAIFDFLRKTVPRIRKRFAGRELLIHISPGTPSMQTIWVLMAETGFVEPPFQLIKSYRKGERSGRSAVVPVEVGIETFYKVYKAAHPRQVASEDQTVLWDPGRFRTETMRNLFLEARRFAYLNVPVLILGERGTGKTTLASWMRLHSPFRREKQDAHWPAVACGQYSPETMRAELFGYKEGAFTGATKDTEGLLATAHGDTLFLDEVGDVSRDLQRLLIKALEEKQYVPLGDDRPKKSDFRLLTATNIDDVELARRLAPDFLDRISMLKLRLPPLREIREEIPWLWEVALQQAVFRSGVGKLQLNLGASDNRRITDVLMRHPLPGNLRDLFRVAYRILAARCDPHEPLPPEFAVEYALEGLGYLNDTPTDREVSKAVARAFSESHPLEAVVDAEGRIPTKTVERELKTYLAEELRRIAKSRGVPVDQLCDVTQRALRSWAQSVDTKSSGGRKKFSEKREG